MIVCDKCKKVITSPSAYNLEIDTSFVRHSDSRPRLYHFCSDHMEEIHNVIEEYLHKDVAVKDE